MNYKTNKKKNGVEIYRVLAKNTEFDGKALQPNDKLKITNEDHPLAGIAYYQGVQHHSQAKIYKVSAITIS